MTKLESKFEQEFKEWVEAEGGLTIKLPANVYSGIPDRMVLHAGKVAFVELKRTGRKPRKLQTWWINYLQAIGFIAMVMDYKMFIKNYKEYGVETLWVSKDNS